MTLTAHLGDVNVLEAVTTFGEVCRIDEEEVFLRFSVGESGAT